MRVSALRAFDFVTCPLTESSLVICLLMRIMTRDVNCNVFPADFIIYKFARGKLRGTKYRLRIDTNKNTFWQKYQCLTLDIRNDQNSIYIVQTLLRANISIESLIKNYLCLQFFIRTSIFFIGPLLLKQLLNYLYVILDKSKYEKHMLFYTFTDFNDAVNQLN